MTKEPRFNLQLVLYLSAVAWFAVVGFVYTMHHAYVVWSPFVLSVFRGS